MKKLAIILISCLLMFDSNFCNGCPCQLEKVTNRLVSDQTEKPLDSKKQLTSAMDNDLSEVNYENEQVSSGTMTTETEGTVSTRLFKIQEATSTSPVTELEVLNETHFELKEPEFETNSDFREVCPYYKVIPELNVDYMTDVWQLVFYRAQEKLSCFEIFIKKTTPEIRNYKHMYSTFNETIDWDKSYLELTSTGKPDRRRHHFLLGPRNGILENIVITDDSLHNNTKVSTLHEHAPGQWLVTKNILLMRDCENGDIVVLKRVPTRPEKRDIEEAMNVFGENGLNETVQCTDDFHNRKYV